jgi:hypothetical protein
MPARAPVLVLREAFRTLPTAKSGASLDVYLVFGLEQRKPVVLALAAAADAALAARRSGPASALSAGLSGAGPLRLLPGATGLGNVHLYRSWPDGQPMIGLSVPGSEIATADALAPFCHSFAAEIGARAHALAALDFLSNPASADGSWPAVHSGVEALTQLTVRQSVWTAHMPAVVDADAADGTQPNPGLVLEMYLDRRPMEVAVLWSVLGGVFAPLSGVCSTLEPSEQADLDAAGAALEADGWLEGFTRNTGQNPFAGHFWATAGPKLRRLARRDALVLWGTIPL